MDSQLQAPSAGSIIEARDSEGDIKRYFSVLPQDEVMRKGLLRQAIAGTIEGAFDKNTVFDGSNFQPNREYIELLHAVIEKYGPGIEQLQTEAQRQQSGSVVVFDRRIGDIDAGVPPEDIIGLFEVENGKLLGYIPNPNYMLWTKKGFSNPGPEFSGYLLEEIRSLY